MSISQAEAAALFLPAIQENGKDYKKFGRITARSAVLGEVVETITGDGKETKNTAKEGDYVVTNTTGEQYILTSAQLAKRYKPADAEGAYDPVGECRAVEFQAANFNLSESPVTFMAIWNEEMVIKDGDMICTPDGKEVYRIARAEFDKTYAAK